jgi:hypothetical protein
MTWEELKVIVNNRLHGITPDQAADYIENNVTDLASAKQQLKQLTLLVLFLANNTGWTLGDDE